MKFRKRISEASETDLTPMLDIVFILLIFFIVTATFLKENAMTMPTPPPDSLTSVQPRPAIIVSITNDNLVRVNGVLSGIDGVRARIETELAANPDQAVLVQAAPETKNRFVIRAVDQAYSAGVSSVGFTLVAS